MRIGHGLSLKLFQYHYDILIIDKQYIVYRLRSPPLRGSDAYVDTPRLTFGAATVRERTCRQIDFCRKAATRGSGPSFRAWYPGTRDGSPPRRRRSGRVW